MKVSFVLSSVLKIPRSELDFDLIDDMLNIFVPAVKSVARCLLSIKLPTVKSRVLTRLF